MAEDANGSKRPLEVCRVFKIDCSGTNRAGIGWQTIKINYFLFTFPQGSLTSFSRQATLMQSRAWNVRSTKDIAVWLTVIACTPYIPGVTHSHTGLLVLIPHLKGH